MNCHPKAYCEIGFRVFFLRGSKDGHAEMCFDVFLPYAGVGKRIGGHTMNCQEAERLVTSYIHGELDEETLEEFLEHIGICENCQEELEIYFTVDSGIRQLDSDADNYNIKGELDELLAQSRQHVRRRRMFQAVRYSVDTLMVMSLGVMIIMQIRILGVL